MALTDLVGVVAAFLTTSCWVPQLVRTLRRGTASDFSWSYLTIYGAGLAVWLLYGLFRRDPVIVVSNAVALVSVATLVTVKLRSRLFRFERGELVVPRGTDPASALRSLRDIGPKLAADLKAVGISDPAALRAAGAEDANRRLMAAGLQTGAHSRKAIEAALEGMRRQPEDVEDGQRHEAKGAIEGFWGTLTLRRQGRRERRRARSGRLR